MNFSRILKKSKSQRQHNFMAAIAHSAEFAAKAKVPQKVGRKFLDADKAACNFMVDKSKCGVRKSGFGLKL